MARRSKVASSGRANKAASLAFGSIVQAKLRISAAGDEYEQEAESVAEWVMRMPEPMASQASSQPGKNLALQRPCARRESGGALCAAREDELVDAPERTDEAIIAHPTAASPRRMFEPRSDEACDLAAPSSVEGVLRSPGAPLDGLTRRFVEPRFGYDFGHVRDHIGARADSAAQAVGARAFTVGRDVVFGAGEYAPAGAEGRRLLAHELTHVLQQSGGRGGLAHASPPGVQRQEVERPAVGEEERESTATVEEEEGSATELDALVAEALAAGRRDAPEVLAKVAAVESLEEAVARLDSEEEALGHLLKALGPDAWLDR